MHLRASVVVLLSLLVLLLAAPILPSKNQRTQSLQAQALPTVSTLSTLSTVSTLRAAIATPDPAAYISTTEINDALPEMAQEALRLINAARTAAGCAALVEDPTLARVALEHSINMAHVPFFSHNPPNDGPGPGTRLRNAGYYWNWYAENIAGGYTTSLEVFTVWKASEGHRENMLNCSLRDIGIGVYYFEGSPLRIYWTADFGTRNGDGPGPTATYTATPVDEATATPTSTSAPTEDPTATPTPDPFASPSPEAEPTIEPTPIPIPGPFKYMLPTVQGITASEPASTK